MAYTPQQHTAARAWQQRRDGKLTCALRDDSLCCHADSLSVSVHGVVQDADAKEPSASGSLGDTSVDATPDASPKSHPVPVERPLIGAGKGASGTASGALTAAAAAAGAVNKGGEGASKPVFKSKKRQVLCTDCKPRKHLSCVLAAT